MAKLQLLAGTTSKTLKVFIQDSSVTTGAGLTGLVFNTASLTAYYIREGAGSATAITLATATLGTFTSSGFIVVDGTNMPGLYEIGIPNAAIAAGAKSVVIMLKGATNMSPCVIEIELTAVDNQSATGFVTSVPSVVGAVGSVTGAVGSVGTGGIAAASFAAGAIDAAAIAANAIGASELATDAANEIADALLDRSNGVETGYTPRQTLRLMSAVLCGKASGVGGVSPAFRDMADAKARVSATTDASGNRTAVTLDAT